MEDVVQEINKLLIKRQELAEQINELRKYQVLLWLEEHKVKYINGEKIIEYAGKEAKVTKIVIGTFYNTGITINRGEDIFEITLSE